MKTDAINWECQTWEKTVEVPCRNEWLIAMTLTYTDNVYEGDPTYDVCSYVYDDTSDIYWHAEERFKSEEDATDFLVDEIACTLRELDLEPYSEDWRTEILKETADEKEEG